MRPKVIAGNWKMNGDIDETQTLIGEIIEGRRKNKQAGTRLIICPPFTSMHIAGELLRGSDISLGGQNMSDRDDGAFTGEISWRLLKSVGCRYVIIGHSERREHQGEKDALINAKVRKAIEGGLLPILCVGETLEQREKGTTDKVIDQQVKADLAGLTQKNMDGLIIAYEPVWAIGTGRTATPEQAQEVHRQIRNIFASLFGAETAARAIIQYGGSVKPDNAAELLAQEDIDGALVGGASLKASSFLAIASAAPA